MRKVLLAAVAAGAMSFAVSAFAQMDEKVYLSVAGKHMVHSGTTDAEVLEGTGGKPADCPTGHFYTTSSSEQMVRACDDDTSYRLAAPESGAMMVDGQPYPEGAMVMKPAN
jgi:hypothetical protein